jgi:hypothetical protein
MTLYFKIDYLDRLFLMRASEFDLIVDEKSLKEEDRLKGRSKSRHIERKIQRNQYMVPTTHFSIPFELRNFEAPAPNLGDGIRKKSRIISQCTRCAMKVPEYKLTPIKLSMLLDSVQKSDLAVKT